MCLVIDLRDVHGSIREVVGAGNEETVGNLLWRRVAIVLDVLSLGPDKVRVEIGNLGNIGMGTLAVVALVVVVCENLPVVVTLHLPGVVKLIVLKVVLLEAGLRVDALKVFVPRNLGRIFAIKVDPDEALVVNVDVDREKTVLGNVKITDVLEARRIGEVAVEIIGPAVLLG